MAIRVVAGGRGKKKKDKGPKLARKYDTKWLGDEPTWETAFADNADRETRKREAMKWYSYFSKAIDYADDIKNWATKQKLSTDGFHELRWPMFSPTHAFLIRMSERGYVFDEHELAACRETYTIRIKAAQDKIKNAPPERKRVEVKKYSKHIMDLDAVEDCWILNQETPIVNFQQSNLVYREDMKIVRKEIETWCHGRIAEYELFLANDPDVREGYRGLDNKTAKTRIQWMKEALQQLVDMFTKPQREKKPRKQKVIPPEKLIRGFRYLAKTADGSLSSADPKGIIGARGCVLYNPGNRFIAIIEAEDNNVLSVRGPHIINAKSCRVTKLRKPEVFLQQVAVLPLKNVQVQLEALTTKITDGKPKSNNDTVVLKVYR